MRVVRTIVVPALILLTLLGCSSDSDFKYLDARSSAKLEIPPDLTSSAANEKFVIPDNFTGGTGETVNKIPVLAQVDTLKLEGKEDFYWLSVEGPVDNLYQLLKTFWASEGFTLEMDEPVVGIMQTDWVHRQEGGASDKGGFIARLFGLDDLSDSQDQYRTRIEIGPEPNVTRIYITHRGTHVVSQRDNIKLEGRDPDSWTFRPSEPELEVEMLSRLMIYLGLKQAQVEQQLSHVKLFLPRASILFDNSENETYLLVKSTQQQTWNRLLHELDRLDLEVLSTNPNSGISGNGVVVVKTNYQTEAEKSSFFSFFADTEVTNKEVTLVISEETHSLTRISIETPNGEVDDSDEGLEFLTMIHEKLK